MRNIISTALFMSMAIMNLSLTWSNPIVHAKNGTIQGYLDEHFNHDVFLGIPYAEPPVGQLRFRNPVSLNQTSWTDDQPFKATEYGAACYSSAFPGDTAHLPHSEDCLTLNVIRPAAIKTNKKFPVGIWIHGGGFQGGGSARDLYNLSYPLQQAVQGGTPIVAVSINYRLGGLGFLASNQVKAEGSLNVGLKDQILAIRWVKENIEAFGGDANQITLWGESAGAISIGHLLTAYEGGLQGLFHGAVLESGFSTMMPIFEASHYQPMFNKAARELGCDNNTSNLECLRNTNIDKYMKLLNDPSFGVFDPTLDGEVIPTFPKRLISKGKFMKIPLVIGGNMDEGTTFGPGNINTTDELKKALNTSYPTLQSTTLDAMISHYSDNPADGSPYGTGDQYFGDAVGRLYELPYRTNEYAGGDIGLLYKLGNSIVGDLMVDSGRRLAAKAWTDIGQTVYTYHWNETDYDIPGMYGATHFVEMVYVFANPSSSFPQSSANTIGPDPTGDKWSLAQTLSRRIMSFVATGDPNKANLTGISSRKAHADWPRYTQNNPKNVYLSSKLSTVENDDYRKEAIDFINYKMEDQLST